MISGSALSRVTVKVASNFPGVAMAALPSAAAGRLIGTLQGPRRGSTHRTCEWPAARHIGCRYIVLELAPKNRSPCSRMPVSSSNFKKLRGVCFCSAPVGQEGQALTMTAFDPNIVCGCSGNPSLQGRGVAALQGTHFNQFQAAAAGVPGPLAIHAGGVNPQAAPPLGGAVQVGLQGVENLIRHADSRHRGAARKGRRRSVPDRQRAAVLHRHSF